MAKFKGLFPVTGTTGNFTFAQTEDGIIVRGKGGVSAKRIATDPNYENTRHLNTDFGAGSEGGKLIRRAFRTAVFGAIAGDCHRRLSSRFTKVVKADAANHRGRKTASGGDLSLLKGFEFNSGSCLTHRFFRDYSLDFNRQTGELRLDLDAFYPDCAFEPPKGATHLNLVLAGALLDFGDKRHYSRSVSSELIAYNHERREGLSLSLSLEPASELPLIVVMGLEFTELLHRAYCPLERGKMNCMGVVKVM